MTSDDSVAFRYKRIEPQYYSNDDMIAILWMTMIRWAFLVASTDDRNQSLPTGSRRMSHYSDVLTRRLES